ncbi:MAG: glycoside hydrolase family 5 protein [Anaerolineae bacterium]
MLLGVSLGSLLWAAPAAHAQTAASELPPPSPVQRCVNLGNTLEAPNEGEWGLTAEQSYFEAMAAAGFDTVRLPVRWSAHASADAPFTISTRFFDRVDTVVGWALDSGLQVILNIHHYEEMAVDPEGNQARLLAIWDQIAAHYADYPAALLFEAMNEPNSALTAPIWNPMQAEVVATIRRTNPTRTIVVGGVSWNSIDGLFGLQLPADDHLLATVHFYDPFQFTHQGAEWADNMDQYLGTEWGSAPEQAAMLQRLTRAANWGRDHNIPVLMGEFGAYSRAPQESRIRWTSAARADAESLGLGWCYWEFAAGFGIYNGRTAQYNDLLPALLPESPLLTAG